MATNQTVLDLMKKMDAAGVPKEKQAIYLGQFKKETGNFKKLTENLNYSSVERLHKIFGKKKFQKKNEKGEVVDTASEYVNNPEKLANLVYDDANRSANTKLGNTEEGDGWKYRGRGFIQVTGRENYAKLSKQLFGDENVLLDDPDILSDPEFGADAAIAWLNTKTKGLTTADEVSNVVNIGESSVSKADRKKYADAFAKQFKLSEAGTDIVLDGDWGKNSQAAWDSYLKNLNEPALKTSDQQIPYPVTQQGVAMSPADIRNYTYERDVRNYSGMEPGIQEAMAMQEPQYMSMEDLLMDKDLMKNPLLLDNQDAETMWRQF